VGSCIDHLIRLWVVGSLAGTAGVDLCRNQSTEKVGVEHLFYAISLFYFFEEFYAISMRRS
jgi:hypothetical protein